MAGCWADAVAAANSTSGARIAAAQAREALDGYEPALVAAYSAGMRAKLGLREAHAEFRARNVVESGIRALLIAAASIAILTAAWALAAAPAAERSYLEAYAAGVNAALAATAQPPFEYMILGAEPEPWQATDSLLVIYSMFMFQPAPAPQGAAV